jgi:hypothetical protein
VPVLLVEKSKCYLIVGKIILAEMEATNLNEGVFAPLASFYLLDFDYPRFLEIGLIVLHIIMYLKTLMCLKMLLVHFIQH